LSAGTITHALVAAGIVGLADDDLQMSWLKAKLSRTT
jgi:hypothetical protein